MKYLKYILIGLPIIAIVYVVVLDMNAMEKQISKHEINLVRK